MLLLCFVTKAQEIKRIISLAPSITENIYLVGGKDKLVGCTSYCKQAIKDGVEQIGSTINVNIEKILSLQPDLVLTMEMTKPQDVATMQKLGIHVEVIKTPKNFDEICDQTMHIATLIGNKEIAAGIINDSKEKVNEIRGKSETITSKNVLIQIGANPIFVVLENTFLEDFITICNCKNIAAGIKHGTMTRESVLAKNPDVIVVADMGGFGKEEQKVWQSYSEMSAAKNKKIFIISSETSCSPTPVSFLSALQDVYSFVKD